MSQCYTSRRDASVLHQQGGGGTVHIQQGGGGTVHIQQEGCPSAVTAGGRRDGSTGKREEGRQYWEEGGGPVYHRVGSRVRTVPPGYTPLPHPGYYPAPHRTLLYTRLATMLHPVRCDDALGSDPPACPGWQSFCRPSSLSSV